jgi:hypothetical protein
MTLADWIEYLERLVEGLKKHPEDLRVYFDLDKTRDLLKLLEKLNKNRK